LESHSYDLSPQNSRNQEELKNEHQEHLST
jgi:hypothetical protein